MGVVVDATLPSAYVPTWDTFLTMQLFWPGVVNLLIVGCFSILDLLYQQAFANCQAFRSFILAYVGRPEKIQMKRPLAMATIQITYMLLCVAAVLDSATAMYDPTWYEDDEVKSALIYGSMVFVPFYLINRLKDGMSVETCWSFTAIVDVVTIMPAFFPYDWNMNKIPRTQYWLNLRYLRAYSAVEALQYIFNIVDLQLLSDFGQELVLILSKLAAMVNCMACTVYVIETLGEFPDMPMGVTKTKMGDLSWWQMNYWMMMTVSTVGYGDYAPTTLLGQLAIVFCVLIGIAFFWSAIPRLVSLQTHKHSGWGRFLPYNYSVNNEASEHIVLLGDGVQKPSSMLKSFLSEVFLMESVNVPDIVIMSEGETSSSLIQFVHHEFPTRAHKVTFLRGNSFDRSDLLRAAVDCAGMTFIVGDPMADNETEEDADNTLRMMEIQRHCPKARVRLMLLQPAAEDLLKYTADSHKCFSASALKMSMMAISTRCPGAFTMIAGMLDLSFHEHKDEKDLALFQDVEKSQKIVGFRLKKDSGQNNLAGRFFGEIAANMYVQSGGNLLLIGAQQKGKIMVNWFGKLEEDQILIGIAKGDQYVDQFANSHGDWRKTFRERQVFRQYKPPVKSDKTFDNSNTGGPATFQNAGASKKAQDIRTLSKSKDLVLLILVAPTNDDPDFCFQHVRYFLNIMRNENLPAFNPIIVFSACDMSKHYSAIVYDKCAFAVGNVFDMTQLECLGAATALSVCVIRGSQKRGPMSEMTLKDYEVINLASRLHILRRGDLNKFHIFDMSSIQAANVLEDACENCAFYQTGIAREKYEKQFQGRTASKTKTRTLWTRWVESIPGQICYKTANAIEVFYGALQRPKQSDEAEFNICIEDKHFFKSGQTFFTDFFGYMLAQMYRCPGTTETLEALALPVESGQDSFLWMVDVPPQWHSCMFVDIFTQWACGEDDSGLIPPGQAGNALVMAIYDRQDVQNTSYGQCTLMPAPDTVLGSYDSLIVLAPAWFGKNAYDLGLLWSNREGSGGRKRGSGSKKQESGTKKQESNSADPAPQEAAGNQAGSSSSPSRRGDQ